MKEELKAIKSSLIGQVQAQMGNLHQVNAKELGEVVDMIKDISETEYYCSIVKAMEDKDSKEEVETRYYMMPRYYGDRGGRMYYDESYDKTWHTPYLRDIREGRSPEARRHYMESRELHKDKNYQMHELENYLKELSNDVIEMVEEASPDERAILKDKITTLANKIK